MYYHWSINEVDFGEDGVGEGGGEGEYPDEADDLDGPAEPGHGVLQRERMWEDDPKKNCICLLIPCILLL